MPTPLMNPINYHGEGNSVLIENPSLITKDECLALARCGALEWNKWRENFPAIEVENLDSIERNFSNIADFSDLDFTAIDKISFSDFNFGDGATFQNSIFPKRFNFIRATFGVGANFTNSKFDWVARFSGAIFGDKADFSGAQFQNRAIFSWTCFEYGANFSHTYFEGDCDFSCSYFCSACQFVGANFGGLANFNNTCFQSWVDFSGTHFYSDIEFQFRDRNIFYRPNYASLIEASRKWAQEKGFLPNTFPSIYFDGAIFETQVNFSGREFLGRTSFDTLESPMHVTRGIYELEEDGRYRPSNKMASYLLPENFPVHFGCAPEWISKITNAPMKTGTPPIFHGCKIHHDTSFDGAQFPKPKGLKTSVRAYRTIKLALSQFQSIRDEQMFFKLEIAEETSTYKWGDYKRWVFELYKLISDFGFSFKRTLISYLIVVLFFALFVHYINTNSSLEFPFNFHDYWLPPFDLASINFAFTQSIPFIAPYNQTLQSSAPKFPHELSGVLMAYKIVCSGILFLSGLSLRNQFRLK